MKSRFALCFLLTAAISLETGCHDSSLQDSEVSSQTETINTETEVLNTALKPTLTSNTKPATLPTETETTMQLETTTASTTTITSTSAEDTTILLNEAEIHADDPYPDYFNYRFSEDSISVRLSGGSYQLLHCDLSESIDYDLDTAYLLEDCNFDSHSDLLVPTKIGENNVTYAIFLWNQETKHFSDNCILFVNPKINVDKKLLISEKNVSPTQKSLELYEWENDLLCIVYRYEADFDKLTLSKSDMKDEATMFSPECISYNSKEELDSALQNLQ